MKYKNFERQLPEGYREVLHINAKNVKFGIIFNAIALVILVLVMIVAFIPLALSERESAAVAPMAMLIGYVVFIVAMIAYIVLHELVHGIAYKALTHEKLTFGLSWSCAYCGVPSLYVSRRTALIALAAPLVTFTVILLPLMAVLFFVHPYIYLACAFLFGLHLGGCAGDMYMLILLLFKYRDGSLLMRDTGPEQFLYLTETRSKWTM